MKTISGDNERAKRVRIAMILKDMTMTELSERTGYDYKYLSRILCPGSKVNDRACDVIAQALDVDPEWIMNGGICFEARIGGYRKK